MDFSEDKANSSTRGGRLRLAILEFCFSTPLRVLFSGAVAIILSIGIKYHGLEAAEPYSLGYLASALLKDFGIALFVVFGIALTVEGPARDRLIKYNRVITENALASYLKTGIRPEFFEYLRRQMQQAVFIRHELVVTIKLTRKSRRNEDDYILVVLEVSYILENTTDKTQPYNVPVYIEKPLNKTLDSIVKCESISINGNAINKKQLDEADRNWPDPPDGSMRRYEHPVDVPRNDRVRIKTVSHTAKPLNSHFVWSSVHPASELTIVCEPGPNIKGFICIMHPECLTKVASRVGASFSQQVKEPVMPGTAAEIVWSTE